MDNMFTNLRKGIAGVLIVTALFLIISCTGSKYSSQKLMEAENAMQKLEQIEAMNYAQSEFLETQEKLEKARRLAEKGRHKKAVLKAEEAEITAELAEVKTLSLKADESLNQLTADIQLLKDRLAKYRKGEQEK